MFVGRKGRASEVLEIQMSHQTGKSWSNPLAEKAHVCSTNIL